MLRKTICTCLIFAAGVCFFSGCEPKVEGYQNPLDVAEARLPKDVKDSNYVLARLEFAEMAMILNCYMRAEPYFEDARKQLSIDQANTAAAIGSERHKYYKGETYERAFLLSNLGFLSYLKGDYNNSRIYFSNAINEDRKAVVKEDTPSIYGDDFALAYYWLGKAYLKLGDQDNARIAFKKASLDSSRDVSEIQKEQIKDRKTYKKMHKKRVEGEQWAWKTFNDPKKPELQINGATDLSKVNDMVAMSDKPLATAGKVNPIEKKADSREQFFSVGYQKDVNFVMAIEVGQPPYKELGGVQNELTMIKRTAVLPYYIRVFIDGYPAGPAYRVLDLWDQAETQDRVDEKDSAQVTKAILKTIADQFVSTGWDVSGDIRYWQTLPGRVYMAALKVKPGLHRVKIEMYDIHGQRLPRMTNTSNGIMIPKDGELLLLSRPYFDCDNAITQADQEKAKKGGARTFGWKK